MGEVMVDRYCNIKYLIRLCIANKAGCMSVYHYFCNNMSPSDISRKMGVSKHVVRGYIQRGERGVKDLLVMGTDPCRIMYTINSMFLVDSSDGMYKCPICGRKVESKGSLMAHVRIDHKDVVDNIITNMILKEVAGKPTPTQSS